MLSLTELLCEFIFWITEAAATAAPETKWLLSLLWICWSLVHLKKSGHGFFDLNPFDTLKHDMKKCTKEA